MKQEGLSWRFFQVLHSILLNVKGLLDFDFS